MLYWWNAARDGVAKISPAGFMLVSSGLVVLQALVLLAMGQPPICTCGYVKLWHGVVLSDENSQQIADWYTFSHIIHGIAFYFILWLIAPKSSVWLRFAIAIAVEVGWEILENTPMIIDRYREATIALGYSGDSILNSLSDIVMMALGFLGARRLPVWASVAIVLILELVPLIAIRDNLLLNVIMLVAPSDAILNWQSRA